MNPVTILCIDVSVLSKTNQKLI